MGGGVNPPIQIDEMVLNDDFRRGLERLGLGEYYNGFVAEAFDSWEVLAQITEDDLTALGVRLGHRRILQRAIAERQSVASRPGSTVQQHNGWLNGSANGAFPPQFDGMRQFPTDAARKKRKYTRHPKIDPNAPPKPPTAYVLFSNHIRAEGTHVQGCTFQEIAKIVGTLWQDIAKDEKDKFLDEAKDMKLVWDRQMAEYRETPQHAEYQAYLKDFKAKHRAPHARRLTTPAQRSSGSSSTDGHFDDISMVENNDDGYTMINGYGSSDRSEASHSRKPSLQVLPPMQSPGSDRSPVTIASLPPSAGVQDNFNAGRPVLAPPPEVDRSKVNAQLRLDRQLPLPYPRFRN